MVEREAICPECGSVLSVSVEKIKNTGKLKIVFFCEGDWDDKFSFEILTGLTNADLGNLEVKGKVIKKEMGIKLIERESDPYMDEGI